MLPVAILCGGLGTRLKPITEKIPKALVEVAGKPFIFHQLEYLGQQNIEKVVLCLGHMGEKIEKEVAQNNFNGLQIQYSYDGMPLKGTGGAIKKAIPLLGDNFYVQYGDSFLPIKYKPIEHFYFESNKPALMTVFRNNNKWDKSNVIFDNYSISEYNKKEFKANMHFIDYGLSILSKSLFDSYSDSESFDLSDLYHQLSILGNLAGFEVVERFYEIGSHEGLEESEMYLLSLSKGV
jgi:N-acetyl-alpha-D-muramate 1-phosphate uridylyltransferase